MEPVVYLLYLTSYEDSELVGVLATNSEELIRKVLLEDLNNKLKTYQSYIDMSKNDPESYQDCFNLFSNRIQEIKDFIESELDLTVTKLHTLQTASFKKSFDLYIQASLHETAIRY